MTFYQGPYAGLMQFSAAINEAPFAAELLQQLEDRYDTIEDAVVDLAEGLYEMGFDIDEEDVLDLLSGEAGPTDELLDALAEGFYEEGEDLDLERLCASAELDWELNGDPEEDEEEEYEEDEDEEDEDDMETEELYYDDEVEAEYDDAASFSQYFDAVEQIQERQFVTDSLDSLMSRASEMVQAGSIPPIAFSILFGEEGGGNQLAQFSAVCEERELDSVGHLNAINYSLDVLEALGNVMNFSQYVEDSPEDYYGDPEEMQFSADSRMVAQASFEAYRAENPV